MEEKTEKAKTVKIFALSSFLNDLGSDIIYPIWPLFVTTFLGANMAVLGFIDGLGDAIVSISQAVSGYISDRIRKRKFFIWLGYFFGALSRIGYAFSFVWQHLIPFRILDRAGKMRGAPRDAMIADASTNENRGRNFGVLRAMDNLGAVCGIIISILFFGLLGYKKLFLFSFFTAFTAGHLNRFKRHSYPKFLRKNTGPAPWAGFKWLRDYLLFRHLLLPVSYGTKLAFFTLFIFR